MSTTPLGVLLMANTNLAQVNKYFVAFGLNNGLVRSVFHVIS